MNFATIGTSMITRKWISQSGGCEGFRLYAVYSRSVEKAGQFAREYGAAVYYDKLEDLAHDPEVDAVYIASPNYKHCEQACMMMEAGKHVICEKPLASNKREAELMVRTAKDNGVLLMEALRGLYDPGFAIIRDNLPRLGTVRRVRMSYSQYSSKYDDFRAGMQRNIFDPACSAGALMDIGVYCVEPVIALFGKPDRVTASSVMLRGGIDGAGTILAAWDGREGSGGYAGMIAELSYSKITASNTVSEIQGEAGTMYITKPAVPGKSRIRYNDGRGDEVLGNDDNDANLRHETEFFIRAAREGTDMLFFHQVSIDSLELMDEVRRQCGIVFDADLR